MDTDTMYKLLGKLDLMDFSADPTMSFVKFCTFTENMFEANSLKKKNNCPPMLQTFVQAQPNKRDKYRTTMEVGTATKLYFHDLFQQKLS